MRSAMIVMTCFQRPSEPSDYSWGGGLTDLDIQSLLNLVRGKARFLSKISKV